MADLEQIWCLSPLVFFSSLLVEELDGRLSLNVSLSISIDEHRMIGATVQQHLYVVS